MGRKRSQVAQVARAARHLAGGDYLLQAGLGEAERGGQRGGAQGSLPAEPRVRVGRGRLLRRGRKGRRACWGPDICAGQRHAGAKGAGRHAQVQRWRRHAGGGLPSAEAFEGTGRCGGTREESELGCAGSQAAEGTCARLLIARGSATLSSERSNGALQAVEIGLWRTKPRGGVKQASWTCTACHAGPGYRSEWGAGATIGGGTARRGKYSWRAAEAGRSQMP